MLLNHNIYENLCTAKKIADHGVLFSFWFVFILPLLTSFLFFLFFSSLVFSGSLSDSPKYEGYIHEVCLIRYTLYIYKSISAIVKRALTTFALIVSAHRYCARKFTRHVM